MDQDQGDQLVNGDVGGETGNLDAAMDSLNGLDRKILASVVWGVDITEVYCPICVNKLASKFGLEEPEGPARSRKSDARSGHKIDQTFRTGGRILARTCCGCM